MEEKNEPAWGPAVRAMVAKTHASLFTISGPYKYEGDMHPSFRIDSDDRLIASVYASDGDIDGAENIANRVADALSSSTRGK